MAISSTWRRMARFRWWRYAAAQAMNVQKDPATGMRIPGMDAPGAHFEP